MRAIVVAALALSAFTAAGAQQTESDGVDLSEPVDTAYTLEHEWEATEPEDPFGNHHVSPMVYSPALTAARHDLKAEIEAWTCSALTRQIQQWREEFEAVLVGEDRQMFASLREEVLPLIHVLLTEQELARAARERNDEEAYAMFSQRRESVQRVLAEIGNKYEDRLDRYKTEFAKVFTRVMEPDEQWGTNLDAIIERWDSGNAGMLDEQQRTYVLEECYTDYMSRIGIMVLFLPALDDCDLEDRTILSVQKSDGTTDLK